MLKRYSILIHLLKLYDKDDVSIHGMSIKDCKTSLFFYIFVGLMMTQGDPKHVAIL
jgi:hypothetical protein